MGKNSVTQVQLWRERPNKFVADLKIDGLKLTAYVFFRVLFSENDCIVTDGTQTEMGKYFWEDRISDAWNYDYPVYYVDTKSGTTVLVTSQNFQELKIAQQIWGKSYPNDKSKKLVICKSTFWESN